LGGDAFNSCFALFQCPKHRVSESENGMVLAS
jgi:hypothetical protein